MFKIKAFYGATMVPMGKRKGVTIPNGTPVEVLDWAKPVQEKGEWVEIECEFGHGCVLASQVEEVR